MNARGRGGRGGRGGGGKGKERKSSEPLPRNLAPACFIPAVPNVPPALNTSPARAWNKVVSGRADSPDPQVKVTSHEDAPVPDPSSTTPATVGDSAPSLTVSAPSHGDLPAGPQSAPFASNVTGAAHVPSPIFPPTNLDLPAGTRTGPNTPKKSPPMYPKGAEVKDLEPFPKYVGYTLDPIPQATDFKEHDGFARREGHGTHISETRSTPALDTLSVALAGIPSSSRNVLQSFTSTLANSFSQAKESRSDQMASLLKDYEESARREKHFDNKKVKTLDSAVGFLCNATLIKEKGAQYVATHQQHALMNMKTVLSLSNSAAIEHAKVEAAREGMERLKWMEISNMEKVLQDFLGAMNTALRACEANDKTENTDRKESTAISPTTESTKEGSFVSASENVSTDNKDATASDVKKDDESDVAAGSKDDRKDSKEVGQGRQKRPRNKKPPQKKPNPQQHGTGSENTAPQNQGAKSKRGPKSAKGKKDVPSGAAKEGSQATAKGGA